jgi:hypothetical protein
MHAFANQTWEHLLGRVQGPLKFRLILQPAVASFIAIRSAIKDARSGHPPYGWTVLTKSHRRGELLREGWSEISKVFAAAFIIDLIYELIVFRTIYPGQSLVVAFLLAILPYPLIRGAANRIFSLFVNRPDAAAVSAKVALQNSREENEAK